MNSRSWLITAPTIGMIILFIVWSGYWYLLKQKAEERIEIALANMKGSNVTLTCAQKSYGGYPFRIQFECLKPKVKIGDGKATLTANAAHLRVLAQAYKLRHFIAEISGQLNFDLRRESDVSTIPAAHTTGSITSSNLRASLVLRKLTHALPLTENLETFSVVGHNPQAQIVHTQPWGQKIPLTLRAEKTGIHLRDPRSPGVQGTDTDLAAEAVNLHVEGRFYTPFGGNQLVVKRMVLNSLVRGFYPALAKGGQIAKNWQQLGGVAEIDAAYLERDDFTVRAEGILSLDDNGQLGGELDAKFLGLDNVFKTLVEGKVMSANQATLAKTGLQILSKSSDEEVKKNIVTIPMRFTQGQIYFGPHSLGFSPSFF